ncbi:MAG TPA: hypothetical protein V6D22_08455 [Candidatus Obscuribacterales bacterium]
MHDNFVVVAGDCKELQNGHSSARDWFMNIVMHANNPDLTAQLGRLPGGGGDTAQGFYIIGADGTYYGWDNSHYLPNVIKFIDKGLSDFHKRPPAHIEIADSQLSERFSASPDATTSVVRVFNRISPLPDGCDELNKSVGRDHLWIYADEVQQLLAASNSSAQFPLPKTLVGRLVRFHLIDNVRGEPDQWQPSDIKQADFSANLITTTAHAKRFHFAAKYGQEAADHQRGQTGQLEGTFDVLTDTGKVANFRAYGKAVAWGRSTWTPGEPKGKFALVTAMVSADDPTSQVVPPQFYWGNGDGYRNAGL